MNILAIGNSFSEDATRYLHGIARADGETLKVANLYIGGCSLGWHDRNMLSDEKAYELQYNGQKTDNIIEKNNKRNGIAVAVGTAYATGKLTRRPQVDASLFRRFAFYKSHSASQSKTPTIWVGVFDWL